MKTTNLFSVKKISSFFKLAIVASLLVNGALLNAQVTVGASSTPEATLDVVASNLSNPAVAEGVIAPRLTLVQLDFKDGAYLAAQNGVIVYVTNVAGGSNEDKTAGVKTPGYYYYDAFAGTQADGSDGVWKSFGSGVPAKQVYRIKPDGVYVNDVRNAALSQTYIDNGNKYHVTGDEDIIIMEILTLGEIVLPTTSNAEEGKTILLLNQNTNSGNTVVSGLKNKAATSPLPWGRGYYIIWVAGNGYLQVRTA